MSIQWILIAQRAGAKLFQSAPSGIHLKLLREIPHPSGRLREQDILSEKAGRLFRPQAGSSARSATDSENTAHDHIAETFALELAKILDHGRTENNYDQLIVIAEPRFLGKIKSALNRPTAEKTVRFIEEDFSKISEHDLEKRLSGLIAA